MVKAFMSVSCRLVELQRHVGSFEAQTAVEEAQRILAETEPEGVYEHATACMIDGCQSWECFFASTLAEALAAFVES